MTNKILSLLLIAPFFIITLYWAIEKYLYLMFVIKDKAGASVTAIMLTMFVSMGIIFLVALKTEKVSK